MNMFQLVNRVGENIALFDCPPKISAELIEEEYAKCGYNLESFEFNNKIGAERVYVDVVEVP